MRNVAQSLVSGIDTIERAILTCQSPEEAIEIAKLLRDATRKCARCEDAAWDRVDWLGNERQMKTEGCHARSTH